MGKGNEEPECSDSETVGCGGRSMCTTIVLIVDEY